MIVGSARRVRKDGGEGTEDGTGHPKVVCPDSHSPSGLFHRVWAGIKLDGLEGANLDFGPDGAFADNGRTLEGVILGSKESIRLV